MTNYICINGDKCCIFTTELSHKDLKEFIIKYKKTNLPGKFDATDWGGCDDIERTLGLRNWTITNDVIEYIGTYKGSNYDHGHSYGFNFEFKKLVRVKKNKKLQC